MDKLRAIECFVAAAQEGSFSRAARRLEVSIPAVAKMVTALERSLGSTLVERTTQGLRLTPDGTRYLEAARSVLDQLREADDSIAAPGSRARGLVTIGAPAFVLQNCLVDLLPRLRTRLPDLEFDFRIVSRVTDPEAASTDVFLLMGWSEVPEMVQRPIAQARYHVYAAPHYWSARGLPRHPADLREHDCLCFRNPEGTLLDLWRFERAGQLEEVAVRGSIASSHRDFIAELAVRGAGVVRVSGLTAGVAVARGLLVRALDDWQCLDGPPLHLLYRAAHRRTARVRAVVDLLAEALPALEAEREGSVVSGSREIPEWQGKHFGRASRSIRSAGGN